MSRLKKLAFGNLTKNDIKIEHISYGDEGGTFYTVVTNEKKMKKDLYWKLGGPDGIDDQNIISYMNYEIEVDNSGEYCQLYIPILETAREYEDSIVTMYMFKEFESNIISSVLSKFNKDNISVNANFANYRLKHTLSETLKQKGIGLNKFNIYYGEVESADNQNIDVKLKKNTLYDYNKQNDKVRNELLIYDKSVILFTSPQNKFIYTGNNPSDDILRKQSYDCFIKNNKVFMHDYCEIKNYFDVLQEFVEIDNIQLYKNKNSELVTFNESDYEKVTYNEDEEDLDFDDSKFDENNYNEYYNEYNDYIEYK